MFETAISGEADDAEALGEEAGRRLIADAGEDFLAAVRASG